MNNLRKTDGKNEIRIVFLHHSTGQNIWNGNRSTPVSKIAGKISHRLSYRFYKKAVLPAMFEKYNKKFNTNIIINELTFPKKAPYGWHNYPYDYYNIWVKNGGDDYFMEEPTLKLLTKNYQLIVFKHCFPVSNIQTDNGTPNIDSDYRSLENYKLQYFALKEKLSEFKDTKFVVITGAARVKSQISEDEAVRSHDFFEWVVNEWDQPDDNIYIWDFYNLQTEGGNYFKDEKAYAKNNSHPNEKFSGYASDLLFNRITDVITTNGTETTLTGEQKPHKLTF
jgi:hypothetical protein